jgi:hypothetical protein
LSEYRRQCKTVGDDFSSTARQQTAELKTATEINVRTARQAAEQISVQLDDAEAVAKQVKVLMESATSEWNGIKTSTTAQCERLQQVSYDLQDRFAWRAILWAVFWFSLTLGFGMFIGHYWIH